MPFISVDEIDGIAVVAHQGLPRAQNGFLARHGPFGAQANLVQHGGDAVAGIKIVVHHQRAQTLQLGERERELFAGVQRERKRDRTFGAHALPAGYRDGAVHHLHKALRNGHAQARALNAADGGIALALERLENVRDKFLAHADAVVLYVEFIAAKALRSVGLFHHPQAHSAARARVFDGIAQQVQKHLIQAQPVAADILVLYIDDIHIQIQLFGVNIGLNDVAQSVQDIGQAARALVQMDLAVFNAAHIQNIVDQAQQMIAGRHDLLQIVLHLLLPPNVREGQRGKADDRVHRRADIVRHIREERAFCAVGLIGARERVLQNGLTLALLLQLVVDAAKAEHRAVPFVPHARPHGLHLEVAQTAAAFGTEIEKERRLFRKLALQPLGGGSLPQRLAVLLQHAGRNVPIHGSAKRQIARKALPEQAAGTFADAQRLALFRVQIKKADEAVINAQRVDQFDLPPPCVQQLLFLELLVRGEIQQKALAEDFAVFFRQLDAAENMDDLAVCMPDTVFQRGGIVHILQRLDDPAQTGLILLHHGGRHRGKAAPHKILLRIVA